MSASLSPSLSPADRSLLAATSTHERVLLAQAVFQQGTASEATWAKVGGVLKGHALLKSRDDQPEWFEGENFKAIYEAMVRSVGQDPSVARAPTAPELRKIAHKYYMDRVYELHAGMQECQDQFRIVYSEIAELKEGRLDWRLTHPERAGPPGSSPVRPPAAELPQGAA
ncbi:hypothetical protein JCM10207_001257 [Rhodosporidiobolus poonsookiae]